MAIFLQWILPCLILFVIMIISYFSPVSNVTPVLYSLFVGIVMLTLKSLLGLPDVVIENLNKKVACYPVSKEEILCFTTGTVVNKSATGEGELKSLKLRVFVAGKEYIDIPIERGEPDVIGFRLRTHGVIPSNYLYFRCLIRTMSLENICDKFAEIRLEVVGQGIKAYKVNTVKQQ